MSDQVRLIREQWLKLDKECSYSEWLEQQLVESRSALSELCRELPCGSHPRLLSLGQPARFVGGCGIAVIAPEAIVCADCGAWFCCRDCAYKHFGSHKEDDALVAAREGRK